MDARTRRHRAGLATVMWAAKVGAQSISRCRTGPTAPTVSARWPTANGSPFAAAPLLSEMLIWWAVCTTHDHVVRQCRLDESLRALRRYPGVNWQSVSIGSDRQKHHHRHLRDAAETWSGRVDDGLCDKHLYVRATGTTLVQVLHAGSAPRSRALVRQRAPLNAVGLTMQATISSL